MYVNRGKPTALFSLSYALSDDRSNKIKVMFLDVLIFMQSVLFTTAGKSLKLIILVDRRFFLIFFFFIFLSLSSDSLSLQHDMS